MGIKNLVSGRRREQQEEERPPNYDAVEEQSDDETDSNSESGEEVAIPLVPPKKPKFITPQKPSIDNDGGFAFSSPSASAFIIMPSQKHSGDNKKPSASKVFSDDDVIALLKGLSVFWLNGKNNKWAEFHLFIKDNLQKQFTKSQVSEKIRALKKKFITNSERAWENGGRLDISDPHEWTVFELSKDLWGDETCIVPEKGQMEENKDEDEADEIVRDKLVSESDEGSKSTKKQKQLGEHGEVNKKTRKNLLEEGEEGGAAKKKTRKKLLEEGEEGGAAKKKTRKKLLEEGEEGGAANKKTRKREQVDELDGKELLKEGIRVDEHDEECGSKGKKKMKKRKQVDERDQANKTAEVDEHVEKKESLKEVNQHDENEEFMNEGKRADEYEEQEVDGHKVKEDLAKQGKQVGEEDNIPADQKQEMKISYDIFQSSYPLLCESFDIFRYPMVAKENCHMIGREKAQELEEKWSELNAEMHNLELKKLDLMKRDSQGRR